MRAHHSPASALGHANSLNRLGDCTNLIDLQEKGVAELVVNGLLNTAGIGDEEIITDNLDLLTKLRSDLLPALKVILLEGILDGDDGVLGNELLVDVKELVLRDHLGAVVVGLLEVEVVELVLEELRSSDIHAKEDLALVAGLLDGLHNEVETLKVGENVGSETTLITDVGGVLTVLGLDDSLEVVVGLHTHAESLREGLGTNGEDHELLHGKLVASVRATVDDVEGGNGHDELLVASELGDVLVEGEVGGLGGGTADGEGDTENGIGTELGLAPAPLVLGSVELLDHLLIDLGLLGGIHTDEGGGDNLVDVLDGGLDTLAHVLGLDLITELESLVDTSGGARGDGGSEETQFGGDIDFDGGIAAGVEYLSGVNGLDSSLHFCR